jgi:hypothetical protein
MTEANRGQPWSPAQGGLVMSQTVEERKLSRPTRQRTVTS